MAAKSHDPARIGWHADSGPFSKILHPHIRQPPAYEHLSNRLGANQIGQWHFLVGIATAPWVGPSTEEPDPSGIEFWKPRGFSALSDDPLIGTRFMGEVEAFEHARAADLLIASRRLIDLELFVAAIRLEN